MDYFILKQSGNISIPREGNVSSATEPSVRRMDDLSALKKFDYIEKEALVSDRMKQLMEQYLPEQPWRACVFINPSEKTQSTFWFLPPLCYQPDRVVSGPDGTPAAVFVREQDFAGKSPGIFRIRNQKGTFFTVVHLSVAESILRRGICGLELVRLSDIPQDCR